MWPVQSKSKRKKHETRPVATDVSCIVVCLSVGHMSCAKTAEPIEVPFGGVNLGGRDERCIRRATRILYDHESERCI